MVNLLWTGGWDSTFRLLQLAYTGTEIQPYYIREQNRDSLEKETQTMTEIIKKINERFPESYIHKTYIIDQSEIVVYPEINKAHKSLLSRGWIGSQYIHIASFRKQKKIPSMELSIERLNNARYEVMPCIENTEINGENRRVISTSSDKDLVCLFNHFSFPILHLTKLDMLNESVNLGFIDILNKTWFCHQPLFDAPCGSCNPCMSTLESGLKYRFSKLSLARYNMKKLIVSMPKTHRFLKRLKYGDIDYTYN